MSLNEVFKLGNRISLPVPVGTKSGDPVRVGGLNGIAEVDVATAEDTPNYLSGQNTTGWASCKLDGAFYVQVTGVTAPGTPVYITAAGALNVTAAGNSLWGHALGTKTAAIAPVVVRIATTGPASA